MSSHPPSHPEESARPRAAAATIPVLGAARTTWKRISGRLGKGSVALTLLGCGAVLLLRRPDLAVRPQFWAEDGVVFFRDAYVYGGSALFREYAGYLHLAPRIVAWVAQAFDPALTPRLYWLGALLLTLYTAGRTQSSRCPWRRLPLLAFAVVLVPDAFEVLLFLANIQWITSAVLLLLALSADPRRWWQHVHDVTAAAIFGLTGPASILLAPAFVWRAWRRRTTPSVALAAIVLGTALTQAVTLVHTGLPAVATDSMAAAFAVPGMRIGASLFVGRFVPDDYARPVEWTLCTLTLALVGWAAFRRGAAREARLLLGWGWVALLVASLYRCRGVLLPLCHPGYGSRYFYPLQMITLWLLLLALRDRRRRVALGAALACAWIVVVNLPRLRETSLTDHHWARYAPDLRAGRATRIPINPPPWEIDVPARR